MSSNADRQQRVQAILDDAMRRREQGESIPASLLVAQHSELADELEAALRRLRLISAARAAAERESAAPEPTAAALQVRCPRCTSTVEMADETRWETVRCPACGCWLGLGWAVDAEPSRPRRVGHFELLRPLGEGSFGEVWEAEDTKLDRRVAVKLPWRRSLSARDREMFLREARAAARLRHPNIVAVFEIGQDGDQCYIVSELVAGRSVGSWLSAREPSDHECARLCGKIARALEHAHSSGIVHRDLKPANIVVDAADEPHLLDFGLAKRDAAATLTLDGQVLGTVAYMSPEQAGGCAHECSASSDLYSLGVVLFEMLTGELPFRGTSAMIAQQILHDEPPSPRRLRADVPRDLETIVLKCLEKDRARRYASAAALADDLERFVRGEPIHARPVGRVERFRRWCGRNRTVATLATTAALALIAGTAAASFFALHALRAQSIARAAADRADYDREMAVRSAFNSQLARASATVPYIPTEAWSLLADAQRCPERLRDFAWRYVANLARRESRVLRGHSQRVNAVVFSPHGETLASVSDDGTIRIWNTRDWSERRVLSGHPGGVNVAVFSPDGASLYSGGVDGVVRRWRLDEESSQELARDSESIECLALSPDGAILAWAASGPAEPGGGSPSWITLVDARTGERRAELRGHLDSVSALLFTPTGEHLVSSGYERDCTIRIWNVSNGECLAVLPGHEARIGGLAICPDGRTLVSGGERLRFWDLESRTQKPTFPNHPTTPINALAVAPDGMRLALGDWSRVVLVVDAATGGHLASLTGMDHGVVSVAFSRDGGYVAAAGAQPDIHVWALAPHLHTAEDLAHPHGRPVAVIDLGKAGLLAASCDDRLTTWDPETGRLRKSWTAGHGEILSAVCTSDGRRALTAGRDGTIRVWDLQTSRLLRGWRGHESAVRAIALSHDDQRLFVVDGAGGLCVRKVVDGSQERVLAHPGSELGCVAASRDGASAAGASNGEVLLWKGASGQAPRTLQGHREAVTALTFNFDGTRLASSSADGTARLWDPASGQCLAVIRPMQGPIQGVSISRDGQTLATTGYKAALWDAVTGQERSQLADPPGFVYCVGFAPDGSRLITGYGDGAVRLRRSGEEAKD